jgi:hypothetical protein
MDWDRTFPSSICLAVGTTAGLAIGLAAGMVPGFTTGLTATVTMGLGAKLSPRMTATLGARLADRLAAALGPRSAAWAGPMLAGLLWISLTQGPVFLLLWATQMPLVGATTVVGFIGLSIGLSIGLRPALWGYFRTWLEEDRQQPGQVVVRDLGLVERVLCCLLPPHLQETFFGDLDETNGGRKRSWQQRVHRAYQISAAMACFAIYRLRHVMTTRRFRR